MEKCDQNIEVLLAFGGNLPSAVGTPEATIGAAVLALASEGVELIQFSALYHSPAITLDDNTHAPAYTNAVGLFSTKLTPNELLEVTQGIERKFGRAAGARWSARTLDIDLLVYGDAVLPNRDVWTALEASDDPAAMLPEPVVPHPRLHKRGFVLVPLDEISPNWQHPVLQSTVTAMLKQAEVQGLCEGVEKLAHQPGGPAK
ncbi:2-amino-4-hydroxy-6-hydroxymethyldihydropteridine diphosphokinase [Kordiimonas sp.]|uniref:2-amino-4-hydroxy-6- hydroxymethyldihydropteridine diphosphokinase n=1 Tax=Kordiimonas sp. TaxID=1970157 RepID=UPI003A924EDC